MKRITPFLLKDLKDNTYTSHMLHVGPPFDLASFCLELSRPRLPTSKWISELVASIKANTFVKTLKISCCESLSVGDIAALSLLNIDNLDLWDVVQLPTSTLQILDKSAIRHVKICIPDLPIITEMVIIDSDDEMIAIGSDLDYLGDESNSESEKVAATKGGGGPCPRI